MKETWHSFVRQAKTLLTWGSGMRQAICPCIRQNAIADQSMVVGSGNGSSSVNIQSILPPSIIHKGCIKITLHNRCFLLMTQDFNYFDYLRPECIKSIILAEKHFVRIDLDRHRIRHCDNRFIYIDLITGIIAWFNISPSVEYSRWDIVKILDDSQMKVLVLR